MKKILLLLILSGFVSAVECGVYNEDVVLDKDLVSSGNCIIINKTGITIDCDGHSITGDGTGFGVGNINGDPNVHHAVVKNCVVSNFERGIWVEAPLNNNDLRDDSPKSTIENNQVSDCEYGIQAMSAWVVGNEVSECSVAGVFPLLFVHIMDNKLFDNLQGIEGPMCDGSNITENEIYGNEIGYSLDGSCPGSGFLSNKVYQNNIGVLLHRVGNIDYFGLNEINNNRVGLMFSNIEEGVRYPMFFYDNTLCWNNEYDIFINGTNFQQTEYFETWSYYTGNACDITNGYNDYEQNGCTHTCGSPPINTPEFPSFFVPLLLSILGAGVVFFVRG